MKKKFNGPYTVKQIHTKYYVVKTEGANFLQLDPPIGFTHRSNAYRKAKELNIVWKETQDLLKQYAIALETFNEIKLGEILQVAENNPGLELAITTLHSTLDTNREVPEHLQEIRSKG